MNTAMSLESVLDRLPQLYAGPGGAVAVLRDGAVIGQRCWGWADIERRIPFGSSTLSLICSITKQFTCALLLDQFPDPTVLDGDLGHFLPLLEGAAPSVLQLCHNQSGLRDYWASAMLCGAPPEGAFGPDAARRLIGRARTLQFAPGTRYSYCNQNFRLLADIIERRTGQAFGALLRQRILDRVGMPHACFNPDAAEVPGGTIGYEGSPDEGFRPAVNRIYWTGDAGLAASLDDMIAWEQFIDATRDDADGMYRRLSASQHFANGAPASYGFGVARGLMHGKTVTSHAGGLRGWRSFRLYAPTARVSVVVLFNHMADPGAAAADLLAAVLGRPEPAATALTDDGLPGRYLEPETGLVVRIRTLTRNRLLVDYSPRPDILTATADGRYADESVSLSRRPTGVHMHRLAENQETVLLACSGAASRDIEGTYHCDELAADLTCITAGGVLYGAFSGELGHGEMQALVPFAEDIWLLPCPRALDYSAPGDWTLQMQRDASGRIASLQIGCWLARRNTFTRQS